jgi:hypothetical protein
MTSFATEDVDVLDRGGIRREQRRDSSRGRPAKGAREAQDRQRAQKTARVHLQVRNHDRKK